MCGRYAFYQRPSEVRRQLEDAHMPVDECLGDDDCRQTYNFPPGAIGVIYRADVPDYGAGPSTKHGKSKAEAGEADGQEEAEAEAEADSDAPEEPERSPPKGKETHYKLQSMKWGLIPSWTKRSPDYGSMMKTINCRDDSLLENRGMWNVPKRRKRCIVICQGFYEWLKKNNGKDRLPYYIKRKDGQLMCFAGLWDCVKYETSDEKHYTYTVITTDSNKQLKFLHDRMPVIFNPGSDELRTWLDPGRFEWNAELQSLLKPFEGELECYQVNKDVGKVGNSSPSFIIPIDSTANKNNIANFFGNQKKAAENYEAKSSETKGEDSDETENIKAEATPDNNAQRTVSVNRESNAPLPVSPRGIKREHDEDEDEGARNSPEKKLPKLSEESKPTTLFPAQPARKMKSSTTNGSAPKNPSPTKAQGKPEKGAQKITSFFGK